MIEQLILKKLVEKYERSQGFVKQESAVKRVLLKPKDPVFKYVNFEDYDDKIGFMDALKDLKSKHLLDFSWEKFEEGNLIKEIWLNVDQIQACYVYLGRSSKAELGDEIMSLLRVRSFSYYVWLNDYVNAVIKRYELKRTYSPELPKEPELAKDMIKLLHYLDDLKGESVYERILSAKLYNDSKHFSKVMKTRFLTLVRAYGDQDPDLEDDQVLESLGLLKHAEIIEFRGCIKLRTSSGLLDFSSFKQGAVINTGTVKSIAEMKGFEEVPICRVLFIENKSNYEHYIQTNNNRNELIVYHGGFYSPLKGQFIRHVRQCVGLENAIFEHWSDIDYGGFLLFERLKRSFIPTLKAYQMDIETLVHYKMHWRTFDERYELRLKDLLDDERFGCFHEVIQFMLINRCKLEQESLL